MFVDVVGGVLVGDLCALGAADRGFYFGQSFSDLFVFGGSTRVDPVSPDDLWQLRLHLLMKYRSLRSHGVGSPCGVRVQG